MVRRAAAGAGSTVGGVHEMTSPRRARRRSPVGVVVLALAGVAVLGVVAARGFALSPDSASARTAPLPLAVSPTPTAAPTPTPGRPAPARPSASLWQYVPDRLEVPLTLQGPGQGSGQLRVSRPDATVTFQVVNGDDLRVGLAPAGEAGRYDLRVEGTTLHVCDGYAGTVVLEANAPGAPAEPAMVDVWYGACDVTATPPPPAPPSVNDLRRTWGDEGPAPWERRPRRAPRAVPAPPPTSPTVTEPAPTEADTTAPPPPSSPPPPPQTATPVPSDG